MALQSFKLEKKSKQDTSKRDTPNPYDIDRDDSLRCLVCSKLLCSAENNNKFKFFTDEDEEIKRNDTRGNIKMLNSCIQNRIQDYKRIGFWSFTSPSIHWVLPHNFQEPIKDNCNYHSDSYCDAVKVFGSVPVFSNLSVLGYIQHRNFRACGCPYGLAYGSSFVFETNHDNICFLTKHHKTQ